MENEPAKGGTPADQSAKPAAKISSEQQNAKAKLIAHWSAIETFTDREHRILKLVAGGYITKEIAALEHQTDNAVEQVIKRARSKCGGIGRPELIRAYIGWEKSKYQGDNPAQSMIDMMPATDRFSADRIPALVSETDDTPQEASVHRDDATRRPVFGAANIGGFEAPYLSLHLPVGMGGSARNELDRLPRLVAILMIAAAGALTAGAALALLFVLDHIAAGH